MALKYQPCVLAVIFLGFTSVSFSQESPPIVATPPHTVIPVAPPPDAVTTTPGAKCSPDKHNHAAKHGKAKKSIVAKPK